MKKERANRLPGFLKRNFLSAYSGVIGGIVLVVVVGIALYWQQVPRGKSLASLFSARNYSKTTDLNENKAQSTGLLTEPRQKQGTEQALTPATKEAKEGIEKKRYFAPLSKRVTPAKLNPAPVVPNAARSGEGNGITIIAVKGQGITHLARFALQRYLNEQKPKVALTKEHKIFIEDFLKDHTKRTRIHPESKLTFSLDLINKAITASQNLTPAKLHNLTRYSKRVPSLNAYTPLT